MIYNPQIHKLGRKAVKTDSRSLKLARYLTPSFTNPQTLSWTKNVTSFGMMKNNQLGCCTISGCGHQEQVWSLNASSEITVSDTIILDAYEQWCGYNPSDPNSDQGGVELDVLTDWRKNGLGGHKLDAFVAVNLKNLREVHRAMNLFGGVYIGVGLPITAQNQAIWDVVPNAGPDGEVGSWGGHCVQIPNYDQTNTTLTCITWGSLQPMTNRFFSKYVDEVWALVGADWFRSSGVDPTGLNLQQLLADVSQIQ